MYHTSPTCFLFFDSSLSPTYIKPFIFCPIVPIPSQYIAYEKRRNTIYGTFGNNL